LNEIVTTGNCPWWLTVSGEGVVMKRLIAESGTGVASEVELLDELEEVEDASAVVGVVEERLFDVCADMPLLVVLGVVVSPGVFVSALTGDDELSPPLEEGFSVVTAPLDADEVRPEVLCAVAPELELLAPWM
jgi:hypothetical protein